MMRVILEAQHAVGRTEPRGIGHYTISLIQNLLRRRALDYELTYFDYAREVGSFERATILFGNFNVPMHECNDLDYRVASRDWEVYSTRTYNEWTNSNGQIYHFMEPVAIPLRLDGQMIVTVHDVNWKSNPELTAKHSLPLYDEAVRRLELTQPYIVADSESAKQQLLAYTKVKKENISVVYQSYDEDNIYLDNSDISWFVQGDYILYVGALATNKNIPRIVTAFNEVAVNHTDLKLVIGGKQTWHDQTPIDNAINSSPFKNRIIKPGYITVEQKRKLYSNALCFVFPSICEGFGIPVLEAMACGCPVITADNTSLPEVGGDAAIYVNAYDTEQLAYEMERVISSESLRKEMARKGFIQKANFSWDKTAEQVENVYRMVMEQ